MSKLTDLAVLGALNERGDMHGYQVRQWIERRLGDYTEIRLGSVYHALTKFNEQGLVKALPVQKSETSPDRQGYRLTARGRDAFLELLREQVTRSRSYVDPLGASLTLIYNLPFDEVLDILEERRVKLHVELTEVERERVRVPAIPTVGRFIELTFDHVLAHLRVEIEWIDATIQRLRADPSLLERPKMDE